MTDIRTASASTAPGFCLGPAGLAPASRSAVSNGGRLHVEPPRDGPWARRHRDLHDALILEYDATTETARSHVRRAAALSILLEQLEAKVASGEPIDADAMVRSSNALRRVLSDLANDKRLRARQRSAAA
jgi:hypothetical protein